MTKLHPSETAWSMGDPACFEQPLRVDRRGFIARMSAISALAAGGTIALPRVAAAEETVARRGSARVAVGVRDAVADDVSEATLAEAITLIRSGRLTSSLLVEAYLDRIGAFDDTLQAFNLVLADAARSAAARAHGGRGALAGIPLAIKDNYYTAGVPTTANSYVFEGFVPPFDATAVARFKAAGAIVLGKTQMGPLATTRATTPNGTITTVNAWTPDDPGVNPGGSSSGSATSVAARMAASSVGTQTGGSITAPSNAQNLTGLKPTMGLVSLFGIIPLTYTRDHPGPLARDAMDAAIMLSVMAGPDEHDPRTQGLPAPTDYVLAATAVKAGSRSRCRYRTRVGYLPDYLAATGDTLAARQAFLAALTGIEGIEVVEVPHPDEYEVLMGSAFNDVRLPERSEPFLPSLQSDLRLFGVSVTSWLSGMLLGAGEYVRGQRAKQLILERLLEQTFTACDVVLQTDPSHFDRIGLPELALPIGFSSGGVPIGAILGGQPFSEDRLLAVAAAYQQVSDWHLRRPADPADDNPPEPIPLPERGGRRRFPRSASGTRTAAPARTERGQVSADDVMIESQ
ncbi:amidase [Propioniciclava soli]|uniref:amidase n=1 Tax=Propioniciclava soli TaxID=2775081 RepID=UPI001E5B04FF|nr:amidase [Propioniciclava soli]